MTKEIKIESSLFGDYPEIKVEEKNGMAYISIGTNNIDFVNNQKLQSRATEEKLVEICHQIEQRFPNYHYEGVAFGVKDLETKKGFSIVISLSKRTDLPPLQSTGTKNTVKIIES